MHDQPPTTCPHRTNAITRVVAPTTCVDLPIRPLPRWPRRRHLSALPPRCPLPIPAERPGARGRTSAAADRSATNPRRTPQRTPPRRSHPASLRAAHPQRPCRQQILRARTRLHAHRQVAARAALRHHVGAAAGAARVTHAGARVLTEALFRSGDAEAEDVDLAGGAAAVLRDGAGVEVARAAVGAGRHADRDAAVGRGAGRAVAGALRGRSGLAGLVGLVAAARRAHVHQVRVAQVRGQGLLVDPGVAAVAPLGAPAVVDQVVRAVALHLVAREHHRVARARVAEVAVGDHRGRALHRLEGVVDPHREPHVLALGDGALDLGEITVGQARDVGDLGGGRRVELAQLGAVHRLAARHVQHGTAVAAGARPVLAGLDLVVRPRALAAERLALVGRRGILHRGVVIARPDLHHAHVAGRAGGGGHGVIDGGREREAGARTDRPLIAHRAFGARGAVIDHGG